MAAGRRRNDSFRRLTRLAVAGCVVLAGACAIGNSPRALSRLDDTASRNSALSYADREIGGGNSIVVDQDAAYEARALIPVSGTYRVVTGGRLRNASALTGSFVDGWFHSFLIPRRPSATARWIVCYGCDVSSLGAPYVVRWQDDNGISIGELR
ncbi:MAG: hypothetical protein E6G60_16745 [Actinobacteria bacterium]|nr:MAG: hypothetical protein E6G60_16745 [Actinomycetota bacterium]